MTVFLKFFDQSQAQVEMPYAFDTLQPAPYGITFDVVGTIYKPTGEILDGIPTMEPVPGYHVNIKGFTPDSLIPYVVVPANPTRIFLGD